MTMLKNHNQNLSNDQNYSNFSTRMSRQLGERCDAASAAVNSNRLDQSYDIS